MTRSDFIRTKLSEAEVAALKNRMAELEAAQREPVKQLHMMRDGILISGPPCDVCGKVSSGVRLADPFGRSDRMVPFCDDHSPWRPHKILSHADGQALMVANDELNTRLIRQSAVIEAMDQFAAAHEQWEADLILCNKAWTVTGLPKITDELWDRAMELQAKRNVARAAKAAMEGEVDAETKDNTTDESH